MQRETLQGRSEKRGSLGVAPGGAGPSLIHTRPLGFLPVQSTLFRPNCSTLHRAGPGAQLVLHRDQVPPRGLGRTQSRRDQRLLHPSSASSRRRSPCEPPPVSPGSARRLRGAFRALASPAVPTQPLLWAHTDAVTLPTPLSHSRPRLSPEPNSVLSRIHLPPPGDTRRPRGRQPAAWRALGVCSRGPGRGRPALSRGRRHTTNKGSANKSRIHPEAERGQWLSRCWGQAGGRGPGA